MLTEKSSIEATITDCVYIILSVKYHLTRFPRKVRWIPISLHAVQTGSDWNETETIVVPVDTPIIRINVVALYRSSPSVSG